MPRKSTSKLFQDEVTEEVTEKEMNLPEEEEAKPLDQKLHEKEALMPKPKSEVLENVIDIDLSAIKKQRFRINGDNSKILELNTSDMGIATRLKEAYPRLNTLMDDVADKFSNMPDDIDEDAITKFGDAIEEIDKKMRVELDYIFNSNVSEICGADGSMWDPIDGAFRYEHIIDKLSKLYENNLDKEFMNMKRRVETKTGKYANLQDHKKKAK